LKEDCRPPAERTAARRYREPTLFVRISFRRTKRRVAGTNMFCFAARLEEPLRRHLEAEADVDFTGAGDIEMSPRLAKTEMISGKGLAFSA
jgi:hypothetical protein